MAFFKADPGRVRSKRGDGREGSRKQSTLPQTGYRAPLRGILGWRRHLRLNPSQKDELTPTWNAQSFDQSFEHYNVTSVLRTQYHKLKGAFLITWLSSDLFVQCYAIAIVVVRLRIRIRLQIKHLIVIVKLSWRLLGVGWGERVLCTHRSACAATWWIFV